MAQWGLIPTTIQDFILEFVDDDTWRDQHLSSVSRDWQLIMPNNDRRRPGLGGTIYLTSPVYNLGRLNMARGLTIETLYKLADHYMQYMILPDHYDHVQIVPNIREYQQIKNPIHQIELENTLQAQHIDPRVPFGYNNVTALDCHDKTEDDVTDNWDSRYMNLTDLFTLVSIMTDTLSTTPLSQIYWLGFLTT